VKNSWSIQERPSLLFPYQPSCAFRAFIAHHNAPLIDERAGTRGAHPTEGGDGHGGVKTGHPFERQLANARGERRDQGRARSSAVGGAAMPID
jgi:hypothetical protein